MAVKFEKLMSLFQEAVEQRPPDEWEGFVRAAAGADEELFQQAWKLLQAHAHGGSLFDRPAVAGATADQPITEKPGTQIGPYQLLQQIGEGGMGVVYMAEQREPIKRRVALKIIKPGMDTRQVIARFEAERQALAMMDHPNIAKVLDAGTTESGRPYFVMELVNGITITQYCDEQHLTPKERLELFIPTCEAIQHAHQKGIIHRDLKPSNILVALYDGTAIPKIIDFGVAKATSQTLTEKTMFTQLGQVMGTLEYMSPEQAGRNQLDTDTRSDIYSLGVVLYELLTGDTPFDRQRLRSAAFDEMLRIIREEEPPRPSTKISGSEALPAIAASRHVEPRKLGLMVRGELDWIVMKSLEKDRGRRYQTASEFADDVGRYLRDETVLANPSSSTYRVRKFVRRHRAAIMTASLVVTALSIGLVGTTWQAIRASHAAARADAEAAISRSINDFLNDDLLAFADPYLEPDRDIKLRTLLDRAALRIEQRYADQPGVKAAILTTLGRTYRGLGEYDKAERFHRRALELQTKTLGEGDEDTVISRYYLGTTLYHQSQFAEARKVLQLAFEQAASVASDNQELLISIRRSLAAVLLDSGPLAEADRLAREACDEARATLGDDHPLTMGMLQDVARVQIRRGDYAAAEATIRSVLRARLANSGEQHPSTLSAGRLLGDVLQLQGAYHEAETQYHEVLQQQQVIMGKDHPATAETVNNLGGVAADLGRFDQAIELYRAALEIRQRILGPDHHSTIVSLNDLATAYAKAGSAPEAEELHRQVLQRVPRLLDGEHRMALANVNNVANAIARRGEFAEADEMYRQVLAIQRRVLPLKHPDTLRTQSNIGINLVDMRRFEDAEEYLRDALDARREVLGDRHPGTLRTKFNLGRAALGKGESDQAERIWRETLETRRQVLPANHSLTLGNMRDLAKLLAQRNELDEAEQILGECLRLQSDKTIDDSQFRRTQSHLGIVLFMKHEFDEAEQLLHEVYDAQLKIDGEDAPSTQEVRANLATVWMSNGKYVEAEQFFRGMLETLPAGTIRTQVIRHNLAIALLKQKKYSEAEPLLLDVLLIREAEFDEQHADIQKTRQHLAILYSEWSWLLATSQGRDDAQSARCLELANQAIKFDQQNPYGWVALGAAHYRSGQWQLTADSLVKAESLLDASDGEYRWFLAMAYWRQGQRALARRHFEQASAALNRLKDEPHRQDVHIRLRAEAIQLMGDTTM